MNGDRYLIKATYLEGPHAGTSYFLRKEGYVTDLYQYQWEDTTYSSKGAAQRACTRKTKDNDWEVSNERKWNQFNAEHGRRVKGEKDFIYWPEKYEPIHVDCITDQVDRSELTRDELIQIMQHDLKNLSCPRDRILAELNELMEAGQN